jgi:phospholipase/lecithinase/hemolysin
MNTMSNVFWRMLRVCALVSAVVVPFGTTALAQHGSFERIVAFGDSLMDSGNAFVLTGAVATQPFAPVPSAAYAIGGHHFSNGRTWVEVLGQTLGLQSSTGPSARNPVVFSNYATGGARARGGTPSVSADQQLVQFLSFTGGSAPADALYIFGFGGNDVRDALQLGPMQGPPLVVQAITAIADNLLSLCTAGAQHILVANVANLGTTPFAQGVGEPGISAATGLSRFLNINVQQRIAAFVQPQCPGTQFYTLDLFALSTAIFSAPGVFGFADSQPCLEFGVIGNTICSNPNEKFFWDAIHPTKAGHALLAAAAAELLESP